MGRTSILGLAAFCAIACAADITVGTATARPGAKVNGYLEIAPGVDAGSRVPVTVINGAKSGPVLALIAGAHGTEYASILALHQFARTLDPSTLSGTVIVAPLLNLASFSQIVPHLNPVDGKGMNRLYPGKADGTQTERVLWAVTKQILEKCDYLIDFHGGDLDENLRRYAYWADTGNDKLDSISAGMAMAFGLDHILIQRNRTPPAPGGPVSVSRQVQMLGKPTLVVEAGHAGTTEAGDISALTDGTLNVMRHLKMLPGEAPALKEAVWLGNVTGVPSDRDGVFHPLAVPEAYVNKGTRIGFVTDYHGNKVADITAPLSGVVAYIRAVPSLRKGDNIANIAEVVANPTERLAAK